MDFSDDYIYRGGSYFIKRNNSFFRSNVRSIYYQDDTTSVVMDGVNNNHNFKHFDCVSYLQNRIMVNESFTVKHYKKLSSIVSFYVNFANDIIVCLSVSSINCHERDELLSVIIDNLEKVSVELAVNKIIRVVQQQRNLKSDLFYGIIGISYVI